MDSLAILEEVSYEYDAARTRLTLATIYFTLGKRAQAQSMLDQCASVFERLGAVLDLEVVAVQRARFGGSAAGDDT